MDVIQDVGGEELHSAYAVGDFASAKEALESTGFRVISLEEQAGLRVQAGLDSNVSKRGNWTREGIIYVPNKGAFLTKASPIMEYARYATNCHENCTEFFLNDALVEKALADSVQITKTRIPTDRFGEEELTRFAFGQNAETYGEFLNNNGINDLQISLSKPEGQQFARQTWLHGTGNDFAAGLDDARFLREVRGVHSSAHCRKRDRGF